MAPAVFIHGTGDVISPHDQSSTMDRLNIRCMVKENTKLTSVLLMSEQIKVPSEKNVIKMTHSGFSETTSVHRLAD